ncbi:MAG: DMT family transporter [Gammaproteobacteria bacterium]|nr:DMT family transporter [Gammaproteobacteria bacterium]
MDWFSLSLLCALSLALADALSKKYLPGYSPYQLLLVRFTIPGLLLIPWLMAHPVSLMDQPAAFWGWMALTIPLELIAMLIYMQAISNAPLHQTLPYLSFTPVFNILTGWLFLGEEASLLGSMGILLVVMGSYLLNLHRLRANGDLNLLEPLRAIFYQQASRRMLLVAFIYSLTSVFSKAAMNYTNPDGFGAFYFVVIGGASVLLVMIKQPSSLSVLSRNLRWHLIIGGLMALMVVTHFVAIAQIEAAYMIAVKRLSLLFGIVLGAWLLHEQGLGRNLASASIMVAGVALILLG